MDMRVVEFHSSIPDFSTINRRINRLNIKIKDTSKNTNPSKEEDEYIIIAIDSSGTKITNRGEWMNKKWNIHRKGYLKVHIAVDIKSKKILSMEVTDEHTHTIAKCYLNWLRIF